MSLGPVSRLVESLHATSMRFAAEQDLSHIRFGQLAALNNPFGVSFGADRAMMLGAEMEKFNLAFAGAWQRDIARRQAEAAKGNGQNIYMNA